MTDTIEYDYEQGFAEEQAREIARLAVKTEGMWQDRRFFQNLHNINRLEAWQARKLQHGEDYDQIAHNRQLQRGVDWNQRRPNRCGDRIKIKSGRIALTCNEDGRHERAYLPLNEA